MPGFNMGSMAGCIVHHKRYDQAAWDKGFY